MPSLFELRKAAAFQGHKFFDPGRPCVNGHSAMRYVSSGECVTCNHRRTNQRHETIRQAREQALKEGPSPTKEEVSQRKGETR